MAVDWAHGLRCRLVPLDKRITTLGPIQSHSFAQRLDPGFPGVRRRDGPAEEHQGAPEDYAVAILPCAGGDGVIYADARPGHAHHHHRRLGANP